MEDPEANLHNFGIVILNKEASNVQWKKAATSTNIDRLTG